MATTRIGISGWRYEPWRGTFYPKDLPQRAELEYASAHLPVIEINGSFYSLQRPESYASWYADTPADFMFYGQRAAVHHAHQALARCRDAGRQLPGVRRVQSQGEAGADPVAVRAQLQV